MWGLGFLGFSCWTLTTRTAGEEDVVSRVSRFGFGGVFSV